MVPLDQRTRFGLDTKQPYDESLDMGCERQQQRGLFSGRERLEIAARLYELVMKRPVLALEHLAKLLVEPHQALATIKIGDRQAKLSYGNAVFQFNPGARRRGKQGIISIGSRPSRALRHSMPAPTVRAAAGVYAIMTATKESWRPRTKC